LSSSSENRRVAVTGGGTAGHILAALEVLSAYRKEFGCEGVFIGSDMGFEARLAPGSGERVELIPARPWARQSWRGQLRAVTATVRAIAAARRILRRERTELVIGMGGYASVAPCLAARTLGLRVAIHEANAVPGLANRILAHVADLVCVDSEETARNFHSGRISVTGTPSLLPPPAHPPAGPPYRFIVLGGSEGSPWLNARAPGLFAEMRRASVDFAVHHLTGMQPPAATQALYDALGVPAHVEGWVTDMNRVYAGATLAIASPGARTLAELASAGIPSLLTPLPGIAHGHHDANGRLIARQAGARFVGEAEWNNAELAAWIASLLAAPEELRAMGESMRTRARSGAADAIVREAEKLFAQPLPVSAQPAPRL
jgi:UDP-N-acetylglucosamine--N-acetylmuramyl-(pentapeptide) pyrophosphoryl-undecaprenol N-acetylglucosamine transferase